LSIAKDVSGESELSALFPSNVPAPWSSRPASRPAQLTSILAAQHLNRVVRASKEIPFDNTSRLVFFSDCHRGDCTHKDAFAPNEMLFLHALEHYYRQGFSYFEVGDGDELWQNRRFHDILRAHWAVFDILHRFDRQGRLHMITGNHDVFQRLQHTVSKDGMSSEEGLLLRNRTSGQRILVTHGHQADIVSDRLSPVARFAVRYIWRHMQDWRITGHFRDRAHRQMQLAGLSSAEITTQRIGTIEKRLMNWIDASRQMTICGHTHRARAAVPGMPPYFNTGSFVTPGEATGLEIQGGEICLVRWSAHPVTGQIHREVLTPPRRLTAYT
jgi:UDP-2,3-diacylglucosamine pyrophosphatase LpxH